MNDKLLGLMRSRTVTICMIIRANLAIISARITMVAFEALS